MYQLTAAKSLVRKAVYYIDNVDPLITAKDLEAFVNGMGIRVVGCFSATPRRSAEHKRLKIVDKTRHAFRLCINGEDNALMTDPNNWSEGINVRRWYFMGKDENFNGDGDQLPEADNRSRSTSVSGATGGAAVADQVLPPSGDLIYQQQQQSTSAAVSQSDMDQTVLSPSRKISQPKNQHLAGRRFSTIIETGFTRHDTRRRHAANRPVTRTIVHSNRCDGR